jgi:riboflavin kinase/FMN adenylyltransferase
MRIIKAGDTSILDYPRTSSITIGSFDGIHCAHQQIIRTVVKAGQDAKLPSGLVTFSPLPQMVIHKGFHFLLTTEEEKETLLSHLGLDFIYKIPFAKDLQTMSPERFLKKFVYEPLRPRKIVVGPDHRFGRNREGDVRLLQKLAQELAFEVIMVPAYSYDGLPVSSTRIRELLLLGNVRRANSLLCRRYSFTATVVKGLKVGTQLGFPTINLQPEQKEKLMPADGVYAAIVYHKNRKLHGALYIGLRPTFGEGNRTIEVYLFDFQGTLYGEVVRVELVDRLRPDQKFKTSNALTKQIKRDVEQIKAILARV